MKGYVSLIGTHQNISETIRMEKKRQAEALRIYRMESMVQAQKERNSVLSTLYYPEAEAIEKLKSLRVTDGSLNYEAIVYPVSIFRVCRYWWQTMIQTPA